MGISVSSGQKPMIGKCLPENQHSNVKPGEWYQPTVMGFLFCLGSLLNARRVSKLYDIKRLGPRVQSSCSNPRIDEQKVHHRK